MQTPGTEPAPFARGDRVIYRPRPAGIETVELIEHRREGWPGWYIRTRREVGPTGTSAHRYDRAEMFKPAETSPIAETLPEPAAMPGGCRPRLARLGRAIGGFVLLAVALFVICSALVELPS
jgi:hypothetical protein